MVVNKSYIPTVGFMITPMTPWYRPNKNPKKPFTVIPLKGLSKIPNNADANIEPKFLNPMTN